MSNSLLKIAKKGLKSNYIANLGSKGIGYLHNHYHFVIRREPAEYMGMIGWFVWHKKAYFYHEIVFQDKDSDIRYSIEHHRSKRKT